MNGIMTIAAGIDMNNYDKTKELIGKCEDVETNSVELRNW